MKTNQWLGRNIRVVPAGMELQKLEEKFSSLCIIKVLARGVQIQPPFSHPIPTDSGNISSWLAQQESNLDIFGASVNSHPEALQPQKAEILIRKTRSLMNSEYHNLCSLLEGVIHSEAQLIKADPEGIRAELFGFVHGREEARKESGLYLFPLATCFKIGVHHVYVLDFVRSIIITHIPHQRRLETLETVVTSLFEIADKRAQETLRLCSQLSSIITLSEEETEVGFAIAKEAKNFFLTQYKYVSEADTERPLSIYYPPFDHIPYTGEKISRDFVATAESLAIEKKYMCRPPQDDFLERFISEDPFDSSLYFYHKKERNADLFGKSLPSGTCDPGKQFFSKNRNFGRLTTEQDLLDLPDVIRLCNGIDQRLFNSTDMVLMKVELYTYLWGRYLAGQEMMEHSPLVPPLGTFLRFKEHTVAIIEPAATVFVTNVDSKRAEDLIAEMSQFIDSVDEISQATRQVFHSCAWAKTIITLAPFMTAMAEEQAVNITTIMRKRCLGSTTVPILT